MVPSPPCFQKKDVDSMGYRSTLNLKIGARVMTTINHPTHRYTNGMMGTVRQILGTEGSHEPRVSILFDGALLPVDVTRETFVVRNPEGDIVFSRKQFPITLAYALTAHKTVGLTLAGIWVKLPFPRVPASRDDTIRAYWKREWIVGGMYTILSRVGCSSQVKVYPLRNSSRREQVSPVFFMDPEASRFDEACKESSWLIGGEFGGAATSQSSQREQRAGPIPNLGADRDVDSHSAHLRDLNLAVEGLSDRIDNLRADYHLANHFARAGQGLERFTDPIVYCLSIPHLASKVDTLPFDMRLRFYKDLHVRLNLTDSGRDLSEEEVCNILRGTRQSTGLSEGRAEVGPQSDEGNPADRSNLCNDPDPDSRVPQPPDATECQSPAIHSLGDLDSVNLDSDGVGTVDEEYEDHIISDARTVEATSEPSEVELTEPDLHRIPHGGSQNELFANEPFLVRRGHLYNVVGAYLIEHDHYRLADLTLEKLRHGRRSCILECRRTASKRSRGKEPTRGSRPDWRLWPDFICPLSQCLVRMERETCYFFPMKSSAGTSQQWRAHSHPHKSYICRSATVPPDVCDHWAALIDEDPCRTLDDLIEGSNEWYASGKYSSSTMTFILNKGLKDYEAIRGAARSIKPNGRAGLSVDAFVEQLTPLRRDSAAVKEEISDIIRSLVAVEKGSTEAETMAKARQADDCIFVGDILCRHSPGERGRDDVDVFAALATSPRMLKNLEGIHTLGVDSTFNCVHADIVVAVLASLPPHQTAKPVGIAIINSENSEALGHVLRQLMNAADDAGVCNHVPKAVVTDGSPANHKALIEVFGPHTQIVSCLFHVIQKAKEKKAAAKLPESVWRAILNDLRLLADATTRDEWRVLRDLCLGEWLQDTHAENVAIKCFFDKFSHYLNDEDWRSYWGSYAVGPRTNNGVEKFNGELKKVLLKSRYRRTLSELGSFFASPRKWIRLSQYGGRQLLGEVTKKQRKLAARLFQREIYCLIPATWHPTSSEHYQGDQWLYARDESQGGSSGGQLSDRVFGEEDFEAKKMVNYSYASLAEVRRLRKTYFIVSYKRTADPHAPPPDGPTCSCIQWSRKHICSHVICTAYLMQEEVSEEWKYLRAFFSLPRRRQRKDGRITDQALPENIRYGFKRGARGPSKRSREKQRDSGRPAAGSRHQTSRPRETIGTENEGPTPEPTERLSCGEILSDCGEEERCETSEEELHVHDAALRLNTQTDLTRSISATAARSSAQLPSEITSGEDASASTGVVAPKIVIPGETTN
ncbi:hypothetical protein FOZ63_015789 [Perkinsus olseni]|uniref:SWIM-type domain-containing protein n=1 Tax=Perkinsus olseni TaxID=32597 RepID=A0A7J6PE07_PEROL|nr:hypothetical protein FOZ60_008236 [Perkinsus olseni]KAF4728078.1 hypothetical protein FOZ63_015789 [Perkinsus olseni]